VKINPNYEPQTNQTGATNAAGSAHQSSSTSGASSAHVSSHEPSSQSGSADKADFSTDAQQFSKLSSKMSSVPQVRQDRVNSLKSAVQNGTHKVSNQQIAQSLSRDMNVSHK
jgi:negative regulator of flagellin synthesis FlgM